MISQARSGSDERGHSDHTRSQPEKTERLSDPLPEVLFMKPDTFNHHSRFIPEIGDRMISYIKAIRRYVSSQK
jgi:hypothetical protein